ncbi:Hypothetical protein FKW44_010768, partial [Caligus rogercresseyi]
MGLPTNPNISDGDSDLSDDEAEGLSENLSRIVLQAPTDYSFDEIEHLPSEN